MYPHPKDWTLHINAWSNRLVSSYRTDIEPPGSLKSIGISAGLSLKSNWWYLPFKEPSSPFFPLDDMQKETIISLYRFYTKEFFTITSHHYSHLLSFYRLSEVRMNINVTSCV